MLKNYFLITIRTLRQNPLYTALSVFGIALTFVFVSVLFLVFETGKGDYIPPGYAERTWQVEWLCPERGPCNRISKEQCELWISKMTTPEMIVVISNRVEETVIINGQGMFLVVLGVDDNYFDVWRHKFLRGRPINRQEIADAAPVIVIDRNTANIYYGQYEDPIGKNFEFNGNQYRVIGVVENSSMFAYNSGGMPANVMVPLETLKTYNQSADRVILFTAKNKASLAEIQAEFTRVFNETNTAEDAQYIIREKRSLGQRNEIIPGIGLILVCLILMLIPALNILSLNVSKSFDRSEEIAIRRAFGAPISTIFGQLFFENIMLTMAGAIVGMCLTPPLMHAFDKMVLGFGVLPVSFSMNFDWKTIILVAGPCVLVFSFLSGSIPAWITAKREIVNVLKGESQ